MQLTPRIELFIRLLIVFLASMAVAGFFLMQKSPYKDPAINQISPQQQYMSPSSSVTEPVLTTMYPIATEAVGQQQG